jgi:hypothetical protein
MALREVRAFYVRETATGKEILITPDMILENPQYRNAIKYVRLDKPVPADTPDTVKMATPQKRSSVTKKKAPPPAKKKASAKKVAKK